MLRFRFAFILTFYLCTIEGFNRPFLGSHLSLKNIQFRTRRYDTGTNTNVISGDIQQPPKHARKSIEELKKELLNAGQAGILAYGCLNFSWYTIAASIVWFSSPSVITSASVNNGVKNLLMLEGARFLKMLAVVWAGSQVTKPFRMAGAIFLSPFADKLLTKVQNEFKINRSTAFARMAITLLSSCLLFFFSLIFSSALKSSRLAAITPSIVSSFAIPFFPFKSKLLSPIKNHQQSHLYSQLNEQKYELNRYNEPIDPKNQRHGWNSHPKICRGFWKIEKFIPDGLSAELTPTPSPSINNNEHNNSTDNNNNDSNPATQSLSTIESSDISIDKSQSDNENMDVNMNRYSSTPWIGREEIIFNKLNTIDHIILKENGIIKIKNEHIENYKWEFTPANRRIIFETALPSEGIVLRFSSEMTRVPYVVTRAVGVVRCRKLHENEDLGDFKKVPSSSNKWPIIAKFQMNKILYGKFGKNKDQASNVKKGLLNDEIEDDFE